MPVPVIEDISTAVSQSCACAADSLEAALTELLAGVLRKLAPAAASGALLLQRPKRRLLVVGSDDCTELLVRAEAEFGEGPAGAALAGGTTILIPDTAAESRWPDYMPTLRLARIRSTVSLPVPGTGVVLVLHAPEPGLSDQAVRAAHQAASGMAPALTCILRTARLTETSHHLGEALRSRTVIDLAVGIIMAQNRCPQDQALTLLKSASSYRNQKLHDVAASIVNAITPTGVSTHFDQ